MSDQSLPQIVPITNKRVKDIAGQRFGRLVALGYVGSQHKNALWLCLCDCGKKSVVPGFKLRVGETKSCGCLHSEIASNVMSTLSRVHGWARTPEYRAWLGMFHRCNDPSAKRYESYGGRGIKICEQWEKFENFIAGIGPRPSAKHSLDRIDNDKGYTPSNTRWATSGEQNNNKRNNLILAFDGKEQTLAQWSQSLKIKRGTLRTRIRLGWSIERALTEPVKRKAAQE